MVDRQCQRLCFSGLTSARTHAVLLLTEYIHSSGEVRDYKGFTSNVCTADQSADVCHMMSHDAHSRPMTQQQV